MLPKHTLKLLKTICKTKTTMPVLSYAHVLNSTLTASDYETTISLTDIDAASGLYNPRTNAIEFLDMSEYPSLEYKQSPNTHSVIVRLDSLKIALKHASKDESRYNLHGIAVTSKGYLIATDGHRCYIESRDNIDVLFILSYQSAKILIELMQALNFETIVLVHDKTHNTITNKHFKTRTIDSQYPEVKHILPHMGIRAQLTEVSVKSAIIACKRAIQLLKKEVDRIPVKLHNDGDHFCMTISPKISPSETYILAQNTTHDITLGINARYLLEAIEHLPKRESILVNWDNGLNPIGIAQSVVMPVRLSK